MQAGFEHDLVRTVGRCLALDVGGSSVKGALVGSDGRLWCADERALDTRASTESVVADLSRALGRLYQCCALESPSAVDAIVGVCLAVPGPFDEERGRFLIEDLPKFEQLYGLELVPLLSDNLPWLSDLKVVFLNDAAAFGLGEITFGAGTGATRVLALTLGTGCGSAFIVDGVVVTHGAGVPRDGHAYRLPFDSGTVDDALSSRGVADLWRHAAPNSTAADPVPNPAQIADLARGGNVRSKLTYRRFGENLARALGPTIGEFAPDVVVLGGNLSRAFDLFGAPAAASLEASGVHTRLRLAHDIGGAALKGVASLLLRADAPR